MRRFDRSRHELDESVGLTINSLLESLTIVRILQSLVAFGDVCLAETTIGIHSPNVPVQTGRHYG